MAATAAAAVVAAEGWNPDKTNDNRLKAGHRTGFGYGVHAFSVIAVGFYKLFPVLLSPFPHFPATAMRLACYMHVSVYINRQVAT
jgi:hypothetical protein